MTPFPPLALLLALVPAPADDAELRRLTEHVELACAPVREAPPMFPYRAFPLGPLSLEVRKAASAAQAKELRETHLGLVAEACGLEDDEASSPFDCGPQCVEGRRAHLAAQVSRVRTLADGFRRTPLRRLAIWAPRGELRVDDVFVMGGRVREAVPSPSHGFVPSGTWKDVDSLASWLHGRGVAEATVLELADGLRAAGLSAIARDGDRLRVVAVGIGDHESGLLLGTGAAPEVGSLAPDGRRYQVVERLADDVLFYETD